MFKNLKKLIRKKIRLGLKKAYFFSAFISIILNTTAPFLLSYNSVVYAQDTQESSVSAQPEEKAVEEVAEKPQEEVSVPEQAVVEETQPVVEGAETEVPEITTEETPATTEPAKEVTDETQGDILPDGAIDQKDTPATPQDISDAKEQVSGKECIASDASISTASEDSWNVNDSTAETKDKVELGVKYEFPFNKDASITFTCLPKNSDDRTTLKIEELKVSDLKLPQEFSAAADSAYDATTGMKDGEFEYTITLPKTESADARLVYVEKSKGDDISTDDLKNVSESNVEQDASTITATDVDHFTIWLVRGNDDDESKISGFKYNDVNGNNSYDNNEYKLDGWKIFIDANNNGTFDNGEKYDYTSNAGRYEFDNVSSGTHSICEVPQNGWYSSAPQGANCKSVTVSHEDEKKLNFGNHQPLTLKATKIVCDDESQLPNWGYGGPDITASTAQNWVNTHSSCHLQKDWKFQWGPENSNNPGDDFVGEAGGAWTTFGPTDTNGVATAVIPQVGIGRVEVREVMQSNYLNFTFASEGMQNSNDVSAEMYCSKDVINYDNWDFVEHPEYGKTFYCVAFNVETGGSISGTKFEYTSESSESTPSYPTLGGWVIKLYDSLMNFIDEKTTSNEDGSYKFDNLEAGIYYVCEEQKDGWKQMSPEDCYQIELSSNQDVVNKNFVNAHTTDITGYKWEDVNGNGRRDVCISNEKTLETSESTSSNECTTESLLSGWTIFIDSNDNGNLDEEETSTITNEDGYYTFEQLLPGTYTICEVQQNGWNQIYPAGETKCHTVTTPNEQTTYNFGNQKDEPVLKISKSNDAAGALHHGDNVTYTITLNLEDGDMHDVHVVDLLPKGFKFNLGSWSANSNFHGPLAISAPEYHSPGTWTLGDMQEGDTITLTYSAQIQNEVDAGTYKDLSWADGKSTTDESFLAFAETNAVNENFVGTSATVVKEADAEVKVEVKEKNVVEEEVLGASTELPATGADTNWLYAVLAMALGGIVMVLLGRKNKGSKMLSVLVIAGLLAITSPKALAATPLMVRVENPATPQNGNFNVTFVTLDAEQRTVVAKCFKKGPSDGGFVQFGSDINISNPKGDTANCEVNSSVLTEEGNYTFKVEVTAGSDNASDTTSAVYFDGTGPDRPRWIKKDKQSSCVYEVKVKSANDGETVKVEIYRDDDKNIQINDGSRVATIVMGPNTEETITDNLSGSCDKPYYAARAFDANGNVSETRVEEIENTTTTTTTETNDETVGAIPTTGSNVTDGSTSGSTTDQGSVLGESSESTSNTDSQGVVAGATDAVKKATSKPAFWILLILGILAVAYVYKNRKATK